ncbi:tetratricopeptide repeat protein [Nitratireductor sp. StC3]|uniref:tetratricopeptide repeat protein n=1 Tax=Nitratireductor sp. StC3 TaxID=2126741 RepID=UPI000D0CB47A|nr:tetratricopeptide repeat protein [Nitratireductor sp. StC3]PSM17585.1 peptidylprolyl isomerase [Nitratireductor sp. StC3]
MTVHDRLGFALSGASADSAEDYETGLAALQRFAGDPVDAVERALAASPAFVMAHVLKGWLYGLATEPEATKVARRCFEAARALPMTAREAGHVAALGALAQGQWHRAGLLLEDLTIEMPRDALALQAGHQIDFFTGNARMLRDRIARALPAWDAAMPGYHALLSAHAFGLEETGDYARAEASGRQAVELEPRDGWGQHAVAHVMEMQSRQADGIAWMRANPDNWTAESFFQVHNWWHLALFHFDLGETDEVLALYDGPIRGGESAVALNMVDASAILWRLFLRGVDTGGRWEQLAELWAPFAGAANYAFNDVHAMMAFAGAGRGDLAANLLEAQRAAIESGGDNAAFTRDVGHPASLAIRTFADGDHRTAIELLKPIRAIAHRFGGSHAQRDVLDLTLMEAALRAGERPLAFALAAERHALRPQSPFSDLLLRRARALPAMAP